jgi:iron complex outermembrane receptor protein
VAVFRNDLKNFIDRSTRGRVIGVGTAPLAQYTNVDARFTGFEADLDWNLVRHVTVEGTVSYVRARFTSPRGSIGLPSETFTDTTYIPESRYPERIPPLNGRVAARYDHQRYFAETGARFAARQERTGNFEAPTPGYTVGDLSAGVRLLRRSQLHTLTLRLDNVFDTTFRNHLARTKDIMPEPGRNLSLLYRLSF